ncbi:MAG TPA: KH domain-containing protein [Candidatus Dojkabacteria bacterium]|nr:KH domain-containing protein [Candidatus Dojkabacteria bacterium]
MKDLLEYIVKSIVNNPDEVEIEEKESVDFPGLMILNVKVSEQDKGVVIGRKGRTINAIRDLITISAIRNNKRVKVLVDEDQKGPRSFDNPQVEAASSDDMLNDEI